MSVQRGAGCIRLAQEALALTAGFRIQQKPQKNRTYTVFTPHRHRTTTLLSPYHHPVFTVVYTVLSPGLYGTIIVMLPDSTVIPLYRYSQILQGSLHALLVDGAWQKKLHRTWCK